MHQKEIDQANGFRTIRSFSKIIYNDILADWSGNSALFLQEDIQWHVTDILAKLNASAKRRTVDNITRNEILQVIVSKEGSLEFCAYRYMPSSFRCGQVTRFAIAWWTDPDSTKIIKIFGDRIHLTVNHPDVPRLIPFGLNPYFVIYPDSTANPNRCNMCKKSRSDVVGSIQHITDPPQFLCPSCKYLHETGFLPYQ